MQALALDIGDALVECGYGGRDVYVVEAPSSSLLIGVEPPSMVQKGRLCRISSSRRSRFFHFSSIAARPASRDTPGSIA